MNASFAKTINFVNAKPEQSDGIFLFTFSYTMYLIMRENDFHMYLTFLYSTPRIIQGLCIFPLPVPTLVAFVSLCSAYRLQFFSYFDKKNSSFIIHTVILNRSKFICPSIRLSVLLCSPYSLHLLRYFDKI